MNSSHMDQPAREQNIQAFVDYFKSGMKPAGEENLGVEVEHFIVDARGNPVGYSGEHGVAWILQRLTERYPRVTEHDGDILAVAASSMNVTIEPAAQLELSAGPFADIKRMREAYEKFEADVAEIIEPLGMKMLSVGYDPRMVAAEKELIPKERYRCMDEYLTQISPYGPRMMRGTASTQVSVDFHSEHDAMVKMRLASILTPVFSLMMDNSPFYEGSPSVHPLMRTEVWRHLDPVRCNTVPGALDPDFSFRKYAEYLLDVPAIVVPSEDWGDVLTDNRTFGEIYADRVMTEDEIFHATGMVWPDARLKTYVEIRPADSVPVPYVIAYEALIKGLFYGQARDILDARFTDITIPQVEMAKSALMAAGYDARVYDIPVGRLADELIALACTELSDEESEMLKPLAELVAQRTTLAKQAIRGKRPFR